MNRTKQKQKWRDKMEKITFKQMVEAVEENNTMNSKYGTSWDSFENVEHIEKTYGKLDEEYNGFAKNCITALIRDNGEGKEIYLEAFRQLFWGVN